jgi:hypothetical protein
MRDVNMRPDMNTHALPTQDRMYLCLMPHSSPPPSFGDILSHGPESGLPSMPDTADLEIHRRRRTGALYRGIISRAGIGAVHYGDPELVLSGALGGIKGDLSGLYASRGHRVL